MDEGLYHGLLARIGSNLRFTRTTKIGVKLTNHERSLVYLQLSWVFESSVSSELCKWVLGLGLALQIIVTGKRIENDIILTRQNRSIDPGMRKCKNDRP